MQKEAAKKQAAKLKKELEKLEDIINAPEGRWKPKKDERYFYYDGDEVDEQTWKGTSTDKRIYAQGNCFKTEEEVENRIELLEHIYKFSIPEEGSSFYWLYNDMNRWDSHVNFGYKECCVPEYHSGYVFNIDAKKKDRDERVRLLKKVCAY